MYSQAHIDLIEHAMVVYEHAMGAIGGVNQTWEMNADFVEAVFRAETKNS